MKIIADAVRFPVTTAVGVILLVLFGAIALFRIPVQLTPSVQEPKVTVTTVWPGASPQEIEREIVDEQEEQLKSLDGLLRMESSSADSFATVTLTFPVGTDVDAALLKVSNRLEQVPAYPSDADKPVITNVDVNMGAIAWFMLAPVPDGGFEGDVAELYDFVDDFIKPEIERVPGVGFSNFFGGSERELQVIVDPARLAARRITINELGSAIDRENRNFSGGSYDESKRRWVVRTVGEYQSPEDVERIVVAVRDGVPVYLRDVAHARLGYRKPDGEVYAISGKVIAINAIRDPGSNVLDVMEELKARVAQLNADLLAPRGLEMVQLYDETEYIESAIGLVQSSLMIGGLLAVGVLLLFLRSGSSTFIIAVAIPISVIGTFLMMLALDRTMNVISLAGLAFAVGMVVDNSIVVLENIYRHRQMGKPAFRAAVDGGSEVWGAVLASTLTTVAVFVPVAFMQEEAGQLFGDIAIAISCAVALSLIISITVIPSLSARILHPPEGNSARGFHNLWGLADAAGRAGDRVAETVYWLTGSIVRRVVVIAGLTAVAVGASIALMPKTEYLPIGNNNFLFGILIPPPGLTVREVAGFREAYREELEPLWSAPAGSPEALAQPGGGLKGFFYVAAGTNFAFMGAQAREPLRVRELLPAMMSVNRRLPGAFSVVTQASIFQQGLDEGRNIDIDISGPELGRLIEIATQAFIKLQQVLPDAQARPIPGLDLDNPEVRIVADRRRAAELGLSNRDLGFAVSALVDGAKASDYQYEGREVDLRVMTANPLTNSVDEIAQMPIATPGGQLVTLAAIADIEEVNGPTTINHRERQRAITLRVTPSESMPLQQAMETIRSEIVDPLVQSGQIAGLYRVSLSGTADKLTQTAQTLQWTFLLAVVITYLLMAALFESFLYPLVIMFSVPLAALGGVLGLATMNLFTLQQLDVLTMLGFIILVGTVVNNAILIVHQSLNHLRDEGMGPREAIRESVRTRIRPIFMSVSTSVLGMLPLVVFPGAGAELYRGLGSVVVGGLIVSTVFTLFLVPSLFSLVLDARAAVAGRLPGRVTVADA